MLPDENLKLIIVDENTERVPNVYLSISPNEFNLPYLPILTDEIETGEPLQFETWANMFAESMEGFPNESAYADFFEFRCFPTPLFTTRLMTLDDSYSGLSWDFPGLVFDINYQMLLKGTALQLAWPSLKELKNYTTGSRKDEYFDYLLFFERVLQPKLFVELKKVLLPTISDEFTNKNVIIDDKKKWGVHHFFIDGYLKDTYRGVMKRDRISYNNPKEHYYTRAEVYLG